ncbi:MAG: SDR family NAD(P)-dependent oxidoreductase, partial [Sediminibacterium sp.]
MKYALITGASKGIGRSIALELAQRGISILLVARSGVLLESLCAEITGKYQVNASFLAADLAAPGAVDQVMQWIHSNGFAIHMLINNAGYGHSGTFGEYSSEEYAQMMRVNMEVPVLLTRALLPSLLQMPRAYVLNIASSAAYQAVPGLTVYAASKSFLLQFSRGLAYELRKTKVSVTVVSPGGTDTHFAERARVSQKAVKAGEKMNMT